MSLVSDALKKIQAERATNGQFQPEKPVSTRNRFAWSPQRMIVLLGVFLLVLTLMSFLAWKMMKKAELKKTILPAPVSSQPALTATATPPVKDLLQSARALANKTAAENQTAANVQLPAPTTSTPAGKPKAQTKEKPLLIQEMTAKTAAAPQANPETDLLRQAQERLASQDYPAAFALLRESLLAEKNAEAYVQIVSCLKSMGNDTLAQAYLAESLGHFPENEALLKSKLIILLRNREYNKALPLTDSLLLRRPQDSILYNYRGVCQYHLQNLPQALAEFQTSLQIDPAAGENYYYIGLILDTRRQYLLALENYRHFLRQPPPPSQRKQWEWTASRVKTLENALAGQK